MHAVKTRKMMISPFDPGIDERVVRKENIAAATLKLNFLSGHRCHVRQRQWLYVESGRRVSTRSQRHRSHPVIYLPKHYHASSNRLICPVSPRNLWRAFNLSTTSATTACPRPQPRNMMRPGYSPTQPQQHPVPYTAAHHKFGSQCHRL